MGKPKDVRNSHLLVYCPRNNVPSKLCAFVQCVLVSDVSNNVATNERAFLVLKNVILIL